MNQFLTNLILAFVTGSLWVILTTAIAEKFGSKIGGAIGGLPSTVVITIFFIGLVESTDVAVQATTMQPLFLSFSGLFLVVYALMAKYGPFKAIAAGIAVWFVLAFIAVAVGYENYAVSLMICLLILLMSYYIFEKKLKIKSSKGIKVRYTPLQILARAAISGAIIVFAVFASRLGGPVFGGMFSVFPAMYSSTMIITHLYRGPKISAALAKTLLVTGVINVAVYSGAVRYFYPVLGLVFGTLAAFGISLVSGYLTYKFIIKKMD
ncbi:TPA: DUF3147 family protein [Candidatus Woesearchaeota archaeon]|nr:hypothetical protein QT06_C0001G0672 [archaeon GW2011_AR15]MBS3103541.1 DUF3147 family protein [Candidatus Woesearchaeota archaeon]HIH41355.1 DUF3147 family protein [Candidatus Woesearchaeota archaeon]